MLYIGILRKWQSSSPPQNLTCVACSLQLFWEMKRPLIVKDKFSQTGTFLGNDSYLPGLTTWWTFSAHPSVHISIHPYLQGPIKETKDREDSCLKRRISTFFYLKGRHKPYYPPVTATNYCWLPGSASTSTCMNGQTQTSLSFYKALLLPFLSFYSFHIYLLLLHWHQGGQYVV